MPNGDGGGFDFGGLFDALLGELAALISAILQFLADLVTALVNVLNFLFAGEQGIFGFSFDSLSQVWQGFKKLLDKIFQSVILASLKKLYSLYQTLQRWAKKLKAWLDRFHALMRKYQIMALRRIINLIQRVRRILVIFRIFHLKFATKLDNWLAGIEGKLISRVFRAERKINEIIFWIDVLVDPTGLFKRAPLAQSLYRYIRGLRGALGIPESRKLTDDEATRQAQDRALLKGVPQLTDPAMQRMLACLDDAKKVYAT